jgi:hypothetical protein
MQELVYLESWLEAAATLAEGSAGSLSLANLLRKVADAEEEEEQQGKKSQRLRCVLEERVERGLEWGVQLRVALEVPLQA